jgi:hypothetical protein
MRYYGLLFLVLASLITSVFVEGKNLFQSEFFSTAYAVMSLVLIIGSKYKESGNVDIVMGMLLIFSVAFLSTQALIEILTNRATEMLAFKVAIIVALDYCALGFLRIGREMKHMVGLKKDDRYGIYG